MIKKLKKKELIILLENKNDENQVLLEIIEELKKQKQKEKVKEKEKIIIKKIIKYKDDLSKKELQLYNKKKYFEKRYKVTKLLKYKNEFDNIKLFLHF
tara:strand:- start:246 stop:539 length:294 start_codon:yes stop_codon:yes gene_type:complete